MDLADPLHARIALLVDEWRRAPVVIGLVRELTSELDAGTEPFVGRPLPEALVRGRLPAPLVSAWAFVLRPRTRNPAHVHPSSTQYTVAIAGDGTVTVGDEERELAPFDPSEPGRALAVIPAGVAHSFEPGDEPLAVLSFHTVAPEDLVEIEVESRSARRYVDESETA